MFTYSRDFLAFFDRRAQLLESLSGTEFFAELARVRDWLETDPRTRAALGLLRDEGETLRRDLQSLCETTKQKLVLLRDAVEALDRDAMADPPASDETAESAPQERFRAFDRVASNKTEARFHAYDLGGDPLEKLWTPLRAKLNNFVNPILAPAQGLALHDEVAARERHTQLREERRAASAKLRSEFEVLFANHSRQLRRLNIRLHGSPVWALRLVEELSVLEERALGVKAQTWFNEEAASNPPGHSSFLELVPAVFGEKSGAGGRRRDSQVLREWTGFLGGHAKRLVAGVREKLEDRVLLLAAVERFRQRAEIHDADRLRGAGGENRLTAQLALYLFDAGFDVLTEVAKGTTRADLVHSDVYVEAKLLRKNSRSAVKKGFWQLRQGIRQFVARPGNGVRVGLLAIFVRGGDLYEIPSVVEADGMPPVHTVVVDIRQGKDRGSRNQKPPTVISRQELLEFCP